MKRLAGLLILAAVLVLPACNGEVQEGGARVSSGGEGQLVISLTDKPLDMDTVANVWVTVDSVIVYPVALMEGSDVSPIEIPAKVQRFDLMTLTGGNTQYLTTADLPAGVYEKIRLRTRDERLVFKDGVEEPLKNDSGKADANITFEILVSSTKRILIDFDAAASIQVNETGNDKYILRPVLHASEQ